MDLYSLIQITTVISGKVKHLLELTDNNILNVYLTTTKITQYPKNL
jgi:hypothetical protein